MRLSYKIGCIALASVFLSAYPLIAGKFYSYLAIEIMIFSIWSASYYLLLGHSGLLSVGHAAYFGVGAYCTALTLIHLPGLPIPFAILVGMVCGLTAGFLIGSLLLRLSKIYFTFATLAFNQVLWAIAWKTRSITGGDDGLAGWSSRKLVLPLIGTFSFGNLTFLYYFVAVLALLAIVICWLFTQTPLGNTLSSMKSNAQRVDFMGINVNIAKLMVLGFSSMIAALSGSLFILFKRMVCPDFIDMFFSFDVVVMSVIGGYSTFMGPIVGSVVYVCLVELLSSFIERWQLVMGIFFVALLLYYPGGIVGMVEQIADRIIRPKGGEA